MKPLPQSPSARAVTRLVAATVLGGAALAHAGTPYPHAKTPPPQDAGALVLARGAAPITVTVALKLRHADELENLVRAQHTPGDANFQRFLTPAEFHARFSPSAATVDEAIAHFTRAGLSATLESGSLLKVTGSADALQKAFGVQLHLFDVAAQGSSAGYRFRAPVGEPAVASPTVAANVEAIMGLDDRPRFRPHLRRPSASTTPAGGVTARAATATGNAPGDWTVTDLAKYYDIQPLYDKGYHGEGRTVGIVTLASFTPSDAYAYWSSVGLTVKPKRIKVIDVDGGPGAPSDDSGSDETTLDVEQSGGVAPAARIIVYQAPNTDQGFVDAFARAINDNDADSVSVSWGEWEWADTQTSVTLGRKKASVDSLRAYNNLFLQAAAQGQSMFAASGDDGAYDANYPGSSPVPDYTKTLSVDSPASSAWITAAGGTTLPGEQLHHGGTYKLNVPTEQVWGWDYLNGLCTFLGYANPVDCGTFPAGSGGGVSSYVPMPFYQYWVDGTRTTEPGQSLVDTTTTPPTTIATLPAHYRGRNVPDVSLNADPETGYRLDYTSSISGFGSTSFYGGTSFVAPQLNGIAALLGQRVKGRLGLLNIPLYALASSRLGYAGPNAPLRDITSGDNWFYPGQRGYDLGSGVGTLDVNNLARALLLLGY